MNNVLKDNDYRNMFINCTSMTFDESELEPEQTNVKPVSTDGFEWDFDMESAYN